MSRPFVKPRTKADSRSVKRPGVVTELIAEKTPDVLTSREAAGYLRVSEQTILTYASRLALPGRQIGGEWRFSRQALEDWLRGRSGKEVLLSQAGAFEEDQEDLAQLRAAIYRERGRPEVEEGR